MTELMVIKETLLKYKDKLEGFGITKIGIFGSYIRGEETTNSDVDLLIDLTTPVKLDLLDLISIEQELTELLNTKVDLVLRSSLKPLIEEVVLNEVHYIYQ